jgi:hypothetical protein
MARPEGFEPPTPRFVVWCSIQLSYGRWSQCRGKRLGIPEVRDSYRLHSDLARLLSWLASIPTCVPAKSARGPRFTPP